MAATGMGRGIDYHPVRLAAEYSGARCLREEETRLIFAARPKRRRMRKRLR